MDIQHENIWLHGEGKKMALLKDPGYHNVLSILLKRLFSLLLETENEKNVYT